MSDQEPGSGGGFTPLTPIGGPSLEQEERAMRSGRGRMVFGMIAAVLVGIGGLVWFVTSEQPSEYGQIGRQINGMRSAHFDAFWGCALPRMDLDDINGAERLLREINERAATPRQYAQHVRETCMVMLDEHIPLLTALIVPEDLRAGVDQLRTAIEALRTAWPAYLTQLDHIEGAYDPEDPQTRQLLTAIATAWRDYKVAHIALNTQIRTHLND